MKIRLPARHYCRYPYETPRGRVDTVEEFDLAETVFLLVDVYGLGFDPGDAVAEMPPLNLKGLHALQSEMVQDRIRPTLDRVREAGLAVVYVENMWRAAAWANSELAKLSDRVCSGDSGSFDDVYIDTDYNHYSKVIAPAPSDFMVQKAMYDGFFETGLDTTLRNIGAKHLVCVGFTADICLLNTVIGAMYRNYRVFVLRDCVLAAEFVDTVGDMAMTQWSIRYYEAMVGYTSTSDQFVAALDAARDGAPS